MSKITNYTVSISLQNWCACESLQDAYAIVFFRSNELRWEVFVSSVVNGGIVDHQCFNFFSLNTKIVILYFLIL